MQALGVVAVDPRRHQRPGVGFQVGREASVVVGGASHQQHVAEAVGRGGVLRVAVVEHLEILAQGRDVSRAAAELVVDVVDVHHGHAQGVGLAAVDVGYALRCVARRRGGEYHHVVAAVGVQVGVCHGADIGRGRQRGFGTECHVVARAGVVVGPDGGVALGGAAHGPDVERVGDVPDADAIGSASFKAQARRGGTEGEHAGGRHSQTAGVVDRQIVEPGVVDGRRRRRVAHIYIEAIGRVIECESVARHCHHGMLVAGCRHRGY